MSPDQPHLQNPPEHDICSNVVSDRGDFRTYGILRRRNMLKKLMITTALSGLMMGAAFAQAVDTKPIDTPAAKSPPAATAPASPAATAARPSTVGAGSAQFINTQKPDQWLASKFKGTDVIGADNEKIGDVSRHPVRQDRQDRSVHRERRRLPGHGRQGRRAGSGRVPGRDRRQVEERGRQAEASP